MTSYYESYFNFVTISSFEEKKSGMTQCDTDTIFEFNCVATGVSTLSICV